MHNNVTRDSNIGRGLLPNPYFQDQRAGFIPSNNREFNGNPKFIGRALINNSQNNQFRNNNQQLNSWQEGNNCVGQNSWQGNNNCGGQNNWRGGCAGQNNFINFQNCRQDDQVFVNDINNHQINSGVGSNIGVGRGRGRNAFRKNKFNNRQKNKFVLDRYGDFHHEQSLKKRNSPRNSYLKRIGPSRFSNARKELESSAAKSNCGDSTFSENSNYGELSEHLEENSFSQGSKNSLEKARNNLRDQDNCKQLNEHLGEEKFFNFVDDCSRENSFQISTERNHVKESSVERYTDRSSVEKGIFNASNTEELSDRINAELHSVRYRSSDRYSDSSERHERHSERSKRKLSSRCSEEKYYDKSDLEQHSGRSSEYRDRSRVEHCSDRSNTEYCPSRSNVDSYSDVENSSDRSNRGQYSNRSNYKRFPGDQQKGKREDRFCRSNQERYQKGDLKVRGKNKVFPLSRPYSYRSFHSRYRYINSSDIRKMPHKRPHDRSQSPESSSRKKGKFVENIENEQKKRASDSTRSNNADKSQKRIDSSKLKRSSHASSAGSDKYMKLEKTKKHENDQSERGKHHNRDKLKKEQRKDKYLQERNRSPSNAKKSRTCDDSKIGLSEGDDIVVEKKRNCAESSVERIDKDTEKGAKGNENLPDKDKAPVKSLTNVGLPTDSELTVEKNDTLTSFICISETLPTECEADDNVAKSSLLNNSELRSSEKETNSATANDDTSSVEHIVTTSVIKDQPSSNTTTLKKVELIKKKCVETDLNSLSEASDMPKQSVSEQENIKSSEVLKCLSSEGSKSLSGQKHSIDSNAKAISIANNQYKKVEQILCRKNELDSTLPKIQKVANTSLKSTKLEAQKLNKADSKSSTGEKGSDEHSSHLDIKVKKSSKHKSGKSGHKSSSAKHSAKNTKLSTKNEVKKHSSSMSSKSGESFDKEKSSNGTFKVLSLTEINGTKSSLDEEFSIKPSDETPKSFRASSSDKDMLKTAVESVKVAKSSVDKVTMRNENSRLNKVSSVDEETRKCSSSEPVELIKSSSVQEKINKQSSSDPVKFIEMSSIDQELLSKNSSSEPLKVSKSSSVDKETLSKNSSSEPLKVSKSSSVDKETLSKNSDSEPLKLAKSSSVDKETLSKNNGSEPLKVSKSSSVDKETLSKNSRSEPLKVSKSLVDIETLSKNSGSEPLKLAKSSSVDKETLSKNSCSEPLKVSKSSSVDKETLSKNSGSEPLKVSKSSSIDKETLSKNSGSELLKVSKSSSVDKETLSKNSGSEPLKVSKSSSVDKETLSKNSGSEPLKVSKSSSIDKETLSKNSGSKLLKVSKSSSVDKETLSKNSGSEPLKVSKSSSVDKETLSKNSGSEPLKVSKSSSVVKEIINKHNEPMNISKLLSVSKETLSKSVSDSTKKTKPSLMDSSSKTSSKSASVSTKHSKSSNVVKEANKSGSNVTGKKMDKNAKSSKFLEKDGFAKKSQNVISKRVDKTSKSSFSTNSSKTKSSKSVDRSDELFSVEKESQRLESEKISCKNAKCAVKESEQQSESGISRGSKNKSQSLHNVSDFDDMLPQLVHKSKRRDRKALKSFVYLDSFTPSTGKSRNGKNIDIGDDTEKVLSSDSEHVISKQHPLNVTDKESNEVLPESSKTKLVNKQAQVVKAKNSDARRTSADTVLKSGKEKSKALLRKCHSQDGKERTDESSFLDQSLFMEKGTTEESVGKEKVSKSLQNKDEDKSLNLTEEKKSEREEVVSAGDHYLYSETFFSDDCEASSEEESDTVKGVVGLTEHKVCKNVTIEGKSNRERNFFDDFVLHEMDNSSDLKQQEDNLKKQKLEKKLSEDKITEENDMKDIDSNKNGSPTTPHCHVPVKSMSDKSEKKKKQSEKVSKKLTKGTSESRKRKHSGKENFDDKRKSKKDKSEFLEHELPRVLSENCGETMTRKNVREIEHIDRSVEGSVSELNNTMELSETNLVPLVMSTPIAKPTLMPSNSVQVSGSVIKDDLVKEGMVDTLTELYEGKHIIVNNCSSVIDKTGLLESKLSSTTKKGETNNSSSFSYLSSFENISDPEDEDNCNGTEEIVEKEDSIPSDDDDCDRLVIDFSLPANTSIKNPLFNKMQTYNTNPISSQEEECGQEAESNTCDSTFLYGKTQSDEDLPISTSESGEEINSKEFDEISEKSNSISSNCYDKNMLEQVTERVKHPSGCVLNSDEEERNDFDNCSEADTNDENEDSASNNKNMDNKNRIGEKSDFVDSELPVNCRKDYASKLTCETKQTCNSSAVKSPHQTEEREGEVENPQMASSSDSTLNGLVIPKSEPLEYESNSQYSNTLNVMSDGKLSRNESSNALDGTVRSEDRSQSPVTEKGNGICDVNQQESNLPAGTLISPSQIKQEKDDSTVVNTEVTDKSSVCSANTDNTTVQNGGECAITNVPDNTLIDRSRPSCASVNEAEDTVQETIQETVTEDDINLDIDEDEIDDNDIRLMIYIKGVPQSPWTPMPPTPRVHSQSDEEDFEPVSVLADLDSSSHHQKSNQESQSAKENVPLSDGEGGCVPSSQPNSPGSVLAEAVNRTPVCAADGNRLGEQGRDEVVTFVSTLQSSSGIPSTELCITVDKVTHDKTVQPQTVQASNKISLMESVDNQFNGQQIIEQTIPKDVYNSVSENADSGPSHSAENSTVVLPASCINQLNEILDIKETKNDSRVAVSGTSKPKTQMSVPEWAADLTPEEISAVEEVRKKSDIVLKFMRSKFKGFSNSLFIDLEHVKIYNCGSCFSTRAYYFPQNMSRQDWRCLLCLGCQKDFSPLGFACHTCSNTPGFSPSLKLNEYETLRRAFVKVSSSSNNFDQIEDAWRVLKAAQMIEYQHCASVDRTCTISHKTLAQLILQTNAYNPKLQSSSAIETQSPKRSNQVQTSVSKGSSTLPGVPQNKQSLVSQKDVLLETEQQRSTAPQVFLQGSNAGRYISQQPTKQGTNGPVLAGAFRKAPTSQRPVQKSFQPQETLHQGSVAPKLSAYERPTAASAIQPAHLQMFTATGAAGDNSQKSLPYRAGQQGLSDHDITAQSSQVRNSIPEGDHACFALPVSTNINKQNILQQPNTKAAHSLTDTQPPYHRQKSSTKHTMLANLLNMNSVQNHTTSSTNPGYATQAWTNTKSKSQMTHGPSSLSAKETHSTNTNQEYLSQQNYIASMQLQNVFNAVTPTSSTITARNPFEISSSVAASNLGNISNSLSGGSNFMSHGASLQQQVKVPDSGNVSKKTFGANLGSTNSFGQSVIGQPVPQSQDNVIRQSNHKNQEDRNLRLSDGQLDHFTAQNFSDINPNTSSAVLSAKQPTLQHQTGQFAQPAPVSSEIHCLSAVRSKNSRVPLPHVLQQKRPEEHIGRTDNHGTVLVAEKFIREYMDKTQNQIPATMIPSSTQHPLSTNNLTRELRNSTEEPTVRMCNNSPGQIATNQNSNQQPVSVFTSISGEQIVIPWESPSLTSNSSQEQLTLTQNSGQGQLAQNCSLGQSTQHSIQGQSSQHSIQGQSSQNYGQGQSTQNYGQGQSTQSSIRGQSSQNLSPVRLTQDYGQGQSTQNYSLGKPTQIYRQGQPSQSCNHIHSTKNSSQGRSVENFSQGQSTQNSSQGQPTQNSSQGQSVENYGQGKSTQNYIQGQPFENYGQGQSTQNSTQGRHTQNSSQGQSVENCDQEQPTQNSSQGQPTQNSSRGQSVENYDQGQSTQNSSQGQPTQKSGHGQNIQNSSQELAPEISNHTLTTQMASQGLTTSDDAKDETPANKSTSDLITEMDDIMKDFQEGVNRQVRAMTRMQSLVRDTIDTMDRNQTSYQEEIANFKEKQEKTEKTFKAALETIKTYMNKE